MSDLAMKYGMQKRMAKGGMMAEPMKEACKHNSMDCPECHGGMMAAGGDVHPDDDDLVMRIMKKRYSKGGEVANKTEVIPDFEPNEFDELAKDDDLEEHETGANSGDEIGDEQEDEDEKDVVSRVMKSRKKKDKMPRPA